MSVDQITMGICLCTYDITAIDDLECPNFSFNHYISSLALSELLVHST